MFGVFGIFEKNINNKDSIFIGGQYQTVIENAEILFNNNALGRTNSSVTYIESSCSEGSRVWFALVSKQGQIIQISKILQKLLLLPVYMFRYMFRHQLMYKLKLDTFSQKPAINRGGI